MHQDAGADAELHGEPCGGVIVGRSEDGDKIVGSEDGVRAEDGRIGYVDVLHCAHEVVGVGEHFVASLGCEGQEEDVASHDSGPRVWVISWLVIVRCILNADILDSSTPLRSAQNDIFCKELRGYSPEF